MVLRPPPTVDITFSLECRQLTSNWDHDITLPWDSAVTEFEKAQAEQDATWQSRDLDPQSKFDALRRYREWYKTTGVEYYATGVRLAFNHGLPDGQSTAATGDTRVVEVTPEAITLAGMSNVGREEGFIDRRTGHAEITWYRMNYDDQEKKGAPPMEKLFKQYILECKPSPRALF
jgi:hypothetical protein